MLADGRAPLFWHIPIARIAHTITFLRGIQPWRTIFFTVGAVMMVLISIHT
jgi:hypothetical protein